MDVNYLKELYKSSEIEYEENDANIVNEYIKITLNNTENIELIEIDNFRQNKVYYNELREDLPKESLDVDEALKNTSKRKYSYFEVKEFVE